MKYSRYPDPQILTNLKIFIEGLSAIGRGVSDRCYTESISRRIGYEIVCACWGHEWPVHLIRMMYAYYVHHEKGIQERQGGRVPTLSCRWPMMASAPSLHRLLKAIMGVSLNVFRSTSRYQHTERINENDIHNSPLNVSAQRTSIIMLTTEPICHGHIFLRVSLRQRFLQ